MANPSILQNTLWGPEATAGTAPDPVEYYLAGLSVTFAPAAGEAEAFRPEGQKFGTFTVPSGTEHAQISLSGKPTYDELAWLFAGLFGWIEPTDDGANAYTWDWSPTEDTADLRLTYTLDRGTTSLAERVVYATMTGLSLTFRRAGIDLAGTMIGQKVDDSGGGIDATPEEVTIQPLLGQNVTIYLEDAYADLAAADPQESIFQVELNFTDAAGPVFNLNKAETGFKETVDLAPTFGGTISIEKNTDGEALRVDMRAGTKKWLRISVVDDTVIDVGPPDVTYSLIMTMPIYLTNPGDQQDQDGVFALGFNFTGVYDASEDFTIAVELICTQATIEALP